MDQYLSQYIGMIKEANEDDRQWSAAQAQKQMDFQKEMSDTAHQREVEDLKKAGLNPVLSAGGAGAAVTSGASAASSGMSIEAMAGLMNKAFQAQIDQAEAIKTTAKGVGGYTGTVSPVSEKEKTAKEAIGEFVQRKTGIKKETVMKAIDQFQQSPIGKWSSETQKKWTDKAKEIGTKIVDRVKTELQDAKDYWKFKFGKK